MISSINAYINYFEGLRRRTLRFAEAVPSGKIDWAPAPGEYTCGDIIRHIGSVQLMNWGIVAGEAFRYRGHSPDFGAGKEEALGYLANCHQEALSYLNRLPDSALAEKRPDLNGRPTSAWRFLMAAVEHEVHHRGQLAGYLRLLGIDPPELFGVKMESLPTD